jgi:hypothetical protein
MGYVPSVTWLSSGCRLSPGCRRHLVVVRLHLSFLHFAHLSELQIPPLRYAPNDKGGREAWRSPLYAKNGRRMGHPKPRLPVQRRRVIPFPTRLREWAAPTADRDRRDDKGEGGNSPVLG